MRRRFALEERVVVRETHVGSGVFAKIALKRGQAVGPMRGTIIDDPDYGSSYCLDLGGSLSLEPEPPFRFLNHSCEANCELVHDESNHRVEVRTLRAIEPGEQLTIDYAWTADAAIRCLCGAKTCRGWVVDSSELPLIHANPTSTPPEPAPTA